MLGGYGWYMVVERVAESGVFTVWGKDAIDSAMCADLYKVFTWLSAQNAKQEFQNRLIEEQNKRRR